MFTHIAKATVAAIAGFSLLTAAAPADAAGPHDRSSHHSRRGHDHHRSHHHGSHHRHSHHHKHFDHHRGHRSHKHFDHHRGHRTHKHFKHHGHRSYHRSHNPFRFHRSHHRSLSPHRSYHRSSYRCSPSYSISFGYDTSCSSYSSIYRYGTSYSYPAYTYPKKYYDPYCRPYSSGVYLSYDTDVYVAADTPRSVTYAGAAPARIIDATKAGPTDVGFKLLAAGEHSRALSFFASAASSDLEEPLAKLGYSLASAAQGNDERALWAMRRAVQAGAADLPSWPACSELTKLADTLKARYQAKADKYVHTPDRDALFMLAALNHATGDTEAAEAALARSYPGGEDFYDAPTRALAAGIEMTTVASR